MQKNNKFKASLSGFDEIRMLDVELRQNSEKQSKNLNFLMGRMYSWKELRQNIRPLSGQNIIRGPLK